MGAQLRIETASGRGIGVTGIGDPLSRRLVLFCHPLPGACGFDPDPDVTRTWGVHLVTADRPGYGSSEPWGDETPDVDTWADEISRWLIGSMDEGDARSQADYTRKIGVVGWGTGGAYALAVARRLPDRVHRLALVGTPTPDRLRDTVGRGDIDIDYDDLPSTAAGHRMGRMIEDAATQGTIGADDDRRAIRGERWSRDLGDIQAKTLLVYPPDERGGRRSFDATWYRRRIPRTGTGIVRGGIPIVHAWRHILEHVAPEHGQIQKESR